MLRSWSEITQEKTKLAAAVSAALVLTFFPRTLTPVFFRRPPKPLTIRVSREVPPKEAFDELFLSPEIDNEWKEIKSNPSTDLNLSATDVKNWNPIQSISQTRVILPTLKLNKESILADFAAENKMNADILSQLTPAERARLQEADDRSQVLSQDWSAPSWREMAERKINQIAKQGATPQASKVQISSRTPTGQVKTPNDFHNATVMLSSDVPNSFKISGKVKMAQGLALGDRTLEVRRFVDGVPLEAGKIDTQTGAFSIDVAEAQGNLTVELFDKSQNIIASANHRLLPEDKDNKFEMEVAAKSQFAGTLVNFNKNPDRLISEKLSSIRGEPADVLYASLGVNEKTDALGGFSFPKIAESSFGLIRTRAKGFVDGIMIVGAGEPKGISLMPQSLMSSLKQIIQGEHPGADEPGGIMWGQVLFDGKPMAGVAVTLEDAPEVVPTYLNGFIPQDGLTTTTENGYFVFLDLPRGLHSVVATRNGEYVGHMNIEADPGSVSIGNVEATTKNQTVPMKIFDAFDGTPVSANVRIQSKAEPLQILGQTELMLPQIQRLSFGFVQPDQMEYMPYQFAYSDKSDFIHLPMIRTDWLEFISSERRISTRPDTSIVVGFVSEDDFEAFLSHEENYDATNIVYFDHDGKVTPSGEAGGGFIMFNVPVSTQSIVVMSKKTEMLSTQVVPVDVNASTVIKFRF